MWGYSGVEHNPFALIWPGSKRATIGSQARLLQDANSTEKFAGESLSSTSCAHDNRTKAFGYFQGWIFFKGCFLSGWCCRLCRKYCGCWDCGHCMGWCLNFLEIIELVIWYLDKFSHFVMSVLSLFDCNKKNCIQYWSAYHCVL